MDGYELEYLQEKFKKHAIRSVILRESELERFKIECPGEELPEWMRDEFEISLALYALVGEVIELRDEVNCLKGDV